MVKGLAFTPEARPLCSSSTEYKHKSTPPAARGHLSVWGEDRLGVEAGAIDKITPSPFHVHAAPTLHAHGCWMSSWLCLEFRQTTPPNLVAAVSGQPGDLKSGQRP